MKHFHEPPGCARIVRVSFLVLAGAAALLAAVPGTAQRPEPRMDCDEERWRGGWFRDRKFHVCEIREETLAATGRLVVDARPNGSVHVTAWDEDEVLVRAQVRAWADDEDEAREVQGRVEIRTDDTIRAEGPGRRWRDWRDSSWSVSYEIFTPRETDLRLDSTNGTVAVDGIAGEIDVETTNGGLRLRDVSGDVHGRTTNGGVEVTLTGSTWEGRGLDLGATNGGVRLRVPEGYSARLEASTTNGGVHVDFPVTVQGDLGRFGRELSATLGEGGPLLSLRTTNGGVHVSKH